MRLDGLWHLLGATGAGLILLGALLAAGGSRLGAWLLLAALAGLVFGHLAISGIAYRRAMARPWPKVEPLSDDDWD